MNSLKYLYGYLSRCRKNRNGFFIKPYQNNFGQAEKYDAKNIVVDPVMVATSGAKLISDEAVSTLKEHLFPLATVLTPNIPEAEVLSEMKISNEEEMIKAAEIISESTVVRFSARADIRLTMQTICSLKTAPTHGTTAKESTIPTHTEQAVHFKCNSR